MNDHEYNCMACSITITACCMCKAIHTLQTCKEYQEVLRVKVANKMAYSYTAPTEGITWVRYVCRY